MARSSSRLLVAGSCWLQQARCQHTSSSSGSAHSVAWLWPVAVAAAAAGLGSLTLEAEAQRQQQQQQQQPTAALAPAAMSAWLAQHGADAIAVEIGPSSDPAAGSALFATPAASRRRPAAWLGPLGSWLLPRSYQAAPLASFPLNLALTAEAAVSDPQLGPKYQQLLAEGVVGEREAVVLLLLVERLRGSSSKWAPWNQQLAARPSTPLTYNDQQMEQLKGTQLAAAAAALRRSALNQWQQVAPAAQAMLQQVGVQQQPSYEDWTWAVATFWSRAQSLPVPAAATAAGSAGDGQHAALRVLEGIVPGLDFANHSMTPNCWWEAAAAKNVTRSSSGSGATGPVVRLMADRVCWPRPGQELTISYGDKGNEELLLLYGFAVPGNPHDTLMVPCPLPPPDQWKEDTPLRLQLLMAQGLRPQLFLTRSHLASLEAQQSKQAARPSQQQQQQRPPSTTCLPQQAQQVLSVFVLSPRELQPRLQQLQQQAHAAGGVPSAASSPANSKQPSSSGGKLQQASALVEELGVHMALITTFVRLLELQLLRLEGPEGTGPLEKDEQLLLQLQEAAASSGGLTNPAQTADPSSTVAAAAAVGAAGDVWLRSCVAYRAGQKQLVRGYLRHATAELNGTMAALTAAVAQEEALREEA